MIVRIVLGVVLASVRVRVARRTRSDNKQTMNTVNVKSAPDTKHTRAYSGRPVPVFRLHFATRPPTLLY